MKRHTLLSTGDWTRERHDRAVREIRAALADLERAPAATMIRHLPIVSKIHIADGETLVSISFVIPRVRGPIVVPPDRSTVATADRPPSGDQGSIR